MTYADGVQLSPTSWQTFLLSGIETFGAIEKLLMKGEVKELLAIALSIMPHGAARSIIEGGLKTNGKGVVPLEKHGSVDFLKIADKFTAADIASF